MSARYAGAWAREYQLRRMLNAHGFVATSDQNAKFGGRAANTHTIVARIVCSLVRMQIIIIIYANGTMRSAGRRWFWLHSGVGYHSRMQLIKFQFTILFSSFVLCSCLDARRIRGNSDTIRIIGHCRCRSAFI